MGIGTAGLEGWMVVDRQIDFQANQLSLLYLWHDAVCASMKEKETKWYKCVSFCREGNCVSVF